MIDRLFWKARIESAWREAPIVWLSGVRRSGKTTIAQSFNEKSPLYVNCDIPASEEMVRDPVLFFQNCRSTLVVFDEIHQLRDPARLLKIGADMFPQIKILATGSSTLAAGKKFRDTLTGRKRTVHLVPVMLEELAAFGSVLEQRLFHGGLPPALLADEKKPAFYREWMDSFFARVIQRLFGFRDINRFTAFLEYVFRQSGGQFDVSKAASELGIARATVESHLRALEATHAATCLRPFHRGSRTEIVKQPKVYGFDTGFVSFVRGWNPLRRDDLGTLWEHVVLESLQARLPDSTPLYWRDKREREIDFVIPRNRDSVDAIECKWNPDAFDPEALLAFRTIHPAGRNFLVCPGSTPAHVRSIKGLKIYVVAPTDIPER
jgi:predicted AAA+ superfamily ATPase